MIKPKQFAHQKYILPLKSFVLMDLSSGAEHPKGGVTEKKSWRPPSVGWQKSLKCQGTDGSKRNGHLKESEWFLGGNQKIIFGKVSKKWTISRRGYPLEDSQSQPNGQFL